MTKSQMDIYLSLIVKEWMTPVRRTDSIFRYNQRINSFQYRDTISLQKIQLLRWIFGPILKQFSIYKCQFQKAKLVMTEKNTLHKRAINHLKGPWPKCPHDCTAAIRSACIQKIWMEIQLGLGNQNTHDVKKWIFSRNYASKVIVTWTSLHGIIPLSKQI